MRPSLSLLLVAALLGGCAAPGARSPAAPPQGGALAHDNLHATVWMQTAAEYRAATLAAFNLAMDRLDAALADPDWDALPLDERGGQPVAGLKPAVIVDADETMIDNSAFQARRILDGGAFTPGLWQGWVAERRAGALPGAVAFARHASERGVTVFFITNRSHQHDWQATYDNLRALGFPVAEDGSNLLLSGDPRAPEKAKETRRKWVGREHRVLLMLGDNLGDFVDPVDGSIDERAALVDRYRAWWGRRWIVLPNPAYGSWEAAATRGCGEPDRSACLRKALRRD
ncbi:MAG: 5'-nucleotidase, lipoprotein e(P4) family [Lysobacteraceae bacterium]|nr:MAG: 5'-nucleotidase, lipoprotein e(P4) family [Xanthomonadaceae bacterium]